MSILWINNSLMRMNEISRSFSASILTKFQIWTIWYSKKYNYKRFPCHLEHQLGWMETSLPNIHIFPTDVRKRSTIRQRKRTFVRMLGRLVFSTPSMGTPKLGVDRNNTVIYWVSWCRFLKYLSPSSRHERLVATGGVGRVRDVDRAGGVFVPGRLLPHAQASTTNHFRSG